MYTYTAGATGLDAAMPTWVQAGGLEKWIERLKDPATRARVVAEMKRPGKDWENLLYGTGSPDKVLLLAFKDPALKPLTGKTLAEVAKLRGKSPEETAIDLVIEDGSRVGTAYFLMDEANVRRQTALPWVGLGSDEAAPAAEGVFLKANSHPRAYGNVARFLGHYVRDEKTTNLADAIRRLTSQPAANLGIKDRGRLAPGMFADIVVFDPATIAEHRELRPTGAIRDRRRPCLRQRGAGPQGRRADWCGGGALRARAGNGEVRMKLSAPSRLGERSKRRAGRAGVGCRATTTASRRKTPHPIPPLFPRAAGEGRGKRRC